jgi:hypothetical protein
VKKNNTKAADFSDVEGAVTALHAPRTDPRPGGQRSKHASTSICFSVGWR